MTDLTLQHSVQDELNFEPSIDAAHIGVTAKSGVITLTGHVATYAEKLAAERAAWRVKGVKAIAQEIDVRFASDKKTADDEIAGRALSILKWNAALSGSQIQVKVQNGLVRLSGQTHWHYQRAIAEAQIRQLTGVKAIINEIVLVPVVDDSDIKNKIENAINRNAEIEAGTISVSVEAGGRVTLVGKVHSWRERAAAERAAWSAPGVIRVNDRLHIAA